MALHLQTFKTRTLTAALFAAIMLTGMLWNYWSFVFLFTVIHFGCWYEFVKLMKKIYAEKYLRYCLFGLIYITIPIAAMILMRNSNNGYLDREQGILDLGYIIPIGIIFSIWINDTMAYIVGSFIGKTPFSKISPKKTWEGTIGGAILCVVAIVALANSISMADIIPVQHWAVIAALCAIFGTIGDLFESKLKRLANVKDSGSFMPGHGGFLDRFDSLLFAAPAVAIFVYIFL